MLGLLSGKTGSMPSPTTHQQSNVPNEEASMAEWMPLHHDPEEEETPQASQKDRRLEQLSVHLERVQATIQESRMGICQ